MTALRDPQQPLEALKLANETRASVHTFKAELADRNYRDALATVVDTVMHKHDDRLLGAAKVRHLLMCVRSVGQHRAAKMMHAAEIHNPEKKLRDLTQRQRWLLVGVLEATWRAWREEQS
jgi:hypothetical protein